MTNLEKIVYELYKKYAIPKRKSKTFESLMIHINFSTNDFIDVIKVLDSFEKEKVINTEGFPQEIYRLFLNESTYLINFQALLSINLERDEWDILYEAIKLCRDGSWRSFDSWDDKKRFVLFAKSSACPLDILKKYEQVVKKITIPKDMDPSDAKHYYSYIKDAKKNITANINLRQTDSNNETLKGIMWSIENAQRRSQEKLARREKDKAHAIENLLQASTDKIIDPEKDFRKAVKLRMQSLFLGEDIHIWAKPAWGKYIGLPQFFALPVQARVEITDSTYPGHYELAALLAKKTNLPRDQLAALASLEDIRRFSSSGLIVSEVFEALAKNPSTPIAPLIKKIERFTSLLDPTYDSESMSSQESMRFFSTHSNPSIRLHAARLPNLSNELFESLSSDEVNDVRVAIAQNTICPGDILRTLSQRDSFGQTLWALSDNPATPIDILESLLEHSDSARQGVASNPNASQEILYRLANDSEDYVRSALASNSNCPVKLLALLAKDSSEHVRNCALNNENCNISVKQTLPHETPDTLISVAELVSGAVPYLNSGRERLFKIVDAPNAPLNDLEIIATKLAFEHRYDWRLQVLKRLVANKNVEVKLLEVLVLRVLAIEDERIRSATMKSKDIKGLPIVLSRRLKRASDEEKRAFESDDFLFFCGKDANKSALSRHPIGVILALCSNSAIDLSRLKTLSKSDDWLVRAAVARNRQTPHDVRLKLVDDGHPLVQILANKFL
jgi:hypothetical protein|tara:strand:+ start:2400 stop:4598 length:2199 start_codon:yes stop_codon:yes gene_type:complete